MDYKIRRVNNVKDKEFIFSCHCQINFECDSDWAIKDGYMSYCQKWMSTGQPNEFFNALLESLSDKRTIAVIVEDNIIPIGYAWVIFTDVPEYNIIIAEIKDIFISPDYRHQGMALELLKHIEHLCRTSGATVLRGGTGINNIASIKLQEKAGFKKYRVEFEKLLQLHI